MSRRDINGYVFYPIDAKLRTYSSEKYIDFSIDKPKHSYLIQYTDLPQQYTFTNSYVSWLYIRATF